MSSFLQNHKRQPRLFIDLPSKGQFYTTDVMDKAESLPVFGMTAMDEMMLRTPDALFSGEATAQIIKSCIPDIKNPWALVGYDIDYILLSIRIATYGESIGVTSTCPKCNSSTDSDINLQALLSRVNEYEIKKSFGIGELKFILQPITYQQTTDFSIENYTLEKQIMSVESVKPEDKERAKYLNDLMLEAARLNLRVALAHIESIEDGQEKEADPETIYKWVSENDLEFYNKIKDTIMEMTESWQLPEFEVQCANEECAQIYKTKMDMDYSNFFAARSLSSRNLVS